MKLKRDTKCGEESTCFFKINIRNLRFEKRLEKFGKFLPEHLKVSKLELRWDPFVQSRKSMTLKFAEELCVMKIKNNAKFEE